jgi:hypothetical protein
VAEPKRRERAEAPDWAGRRSVIAAILLLLNPPVPSFLRATLPKAAIKAAEAVGFRKDGPFVIVFMKSGCHSCFSLAQGLKEATEAGWLARDAITCFLADGSENSKVEAVMRSTTPFLAESTSADIFSTCEITATPAMLAVDSDTWQVFGHSVGGDAAWAVSRLQMGRTRQVLPTVAPDSRNAMDPQASI